MWHPLVGISSVILTKYHMSCIYFMKLSRLLHPCMACICRSFIARRNRWVSRERTLNCCMMRQLLQSGISFVNTGHWISIVCGSLLRSPLLNHNHFKSATIVVIVSAPCYCQNLSVIELSFVGPSVHKWHGDLGLIMKHWPLASSCF